MGKMGHLIHRSLMKTTVSTLTVDDPLHIRFKEFDKGEQAIAFRHVPVTKQLRFPKEKYFRDALMAFINLPRKELMEIRKQHPNGCPCRHEKKLAITEEHARTCQALGEQTKMHNAIANEIHTCANSLTYHCVEIKKSLNGQGTKGERPDLLITNMPMTANRILSREYLDVTGSNLLCPTNRVLAQGPRDNVLITRETEKQDKYEKQCADLHATFRGLAFCDSGKLGPNFHKFYKELFAPFRQKHLWDEDEDYDRMILSPKQWTVANPMILWKTRLYVRIIVEREKRVETYIKYLVDKAQFNTLHEFQSHTLV